MTGERLTRDNLRVRFGDERNFVLIGFDLVIHTALLSSTDSRRTTIRRTNSRYVLRPLRRLIVHHLRDSSANHQCYRIRLP